jgi:hypothetical protein
MIIKDNKIGNKIEHIEHEYNYKVEYEYIVPHDKIRLIFAKVLRRSIISSNIDEKLVNKNNDDRNTNNDDINYKMKMEIESIVVLSDGTAIKLNFNI